jgi:NADH-quinone oxidoreductase subunit C
MTPSAVDAAEALAAVVPGAAVDTGSGETVVDVPVERWRAAVTEARDRHGLELFDWLSAVDEPPESISVLCHLAGAAGRPRLLLRARLPRPDPVLETVTSVFPGADWHERETAEMFGVRFAGHPAPGPLLLPPGFEGHPLRKDFVLGARVVRTWPGALEPGESEPSPGRRRSRPLGVPDQP